MSAQALNRDLYRTVYLIRRAEEAIKENYLDDEMKTPMHMSMGAEAIAAGVCQALDRHDPVLGTYRSHGLYLAKTGESDRFFAEMYGRDTGMAQGKAGSMHLSAPEEGLIGTSAIVASNIPVALGAAFSHKQRNTGRVTAVFFGDGAIDEGVFWESLNSASLMKLPVLFVCEDNGYAVHIPAEQRHGYSDIAEVVSRFDCGVHRSESTDAEVIYTLTRDALADMSATGRPQFLHLKYYRYLEHVGVFEDFKAGYRPRDAFEPWLERDPVKVQREKVVGLLGEEAVAALEAEIDQQVAKSLEFAKQSPFPARSAVVEDVLA
ncbi:MAG: thiamine pyrophosphate-dependent dehydrogenase E1 component subunit alpha [Magnetococcales bacterium]|nr:thiamine pyrophosphate-dependent dehydrogenase E1 component subunit alpha [Magnetococcales bacterium]